MIEMKRRIRTDLRILYRQARKKPWCFLVNVVREKNRGGTPKFRTPLYPRWAFVCGFVKISDQPRSEKKQNRRKGWGKAFSENFDLGLGVSYG